MNSREMESLPFEKKQMVSRTKKNEAVRNLIKRTLDLSILTDKVVYYDKAGETEKCYLALFHYGDADTWYLVESKLDFSQTIIHIMDNQRTAIDYTEWYTWREITSDSEISRVTEKLKGKLLARLMSELSAVFEL